MALLGASLLLLALTFALPGPTLPRRLLQAIEGSRSLLQPQGRHQAPLRAPAAAAAAAEAAEAEMPAQLPTCSLDIEASPFARSCTRLEDVCVDQVGGLGGRQGGLRMGDCTPAAAMRSANRTPTARYPPRPTFAWLQGRAILYGRRLHPQRSGEPPLGMPVVPWDERHAHTQVEYLTGDGHRLSYRW